MTATGVCEAHTGLPFLKARGGPDNGRLEKSPRAVGVNSLKVGEAGSVLSLVKRPRDDDEGRGDEDVGTGPPLPGIKNRPPSGICQDGRRVGPVAVTGAPSV